VYELKNDSRVEDLVKISGGFKDTADTYSLNLAKKLKDEDYIHVDEIKKMAMVKTILIKMKNLG
jgi:SLBB domain.